MDCDDADCTDTHPCFRHKLQYWRETGGLRLAAAATPSRTPSKAPPSKSHNSWENGIPRDDRGMPYLDSRLEPMGQKKVAENRHAIEELHRKFRAAPNQPS